MKSSILKDTKPGKLVTVKAKAVDLGAMQSVVEHNANALKKANTALQNAITTQQDAEANYLRAQKEFADGVKAVQSATRIVL